MAANAITRRRRVGALHDQNTEKSTDRIPETLQTVLVVANRGKEVNAPPPGGVAYRLFGRSSETASKKSSSSSWSWFGSWSDSSKPRRRTSRRNSCENTVSTLDDSTTSASSSRPPLRQSKKGSTSPKTTTPEAPVSSPAPSTKHHVSPQSYFDSLLKNRGYSNATFKSLESAYHNKPTPLQVASHGVKLTEAIRSNNLDMLQGLLEAGLSPNACNEYGESIVHMVCRLGNAECLRVLLAHGCVVQVCDDYGRNPMHDACWSTRVSFECVDLLLGQDPHLLCLEDSRGSTPLSYLKEDQWTSWTKFLMSKKETYWPDRDMVALGAEPAPELTKAASNSRPIPDPKQSISLELAKMVAAGRMTPMEALLMMDDDSDDDEDDSDDESLEEDSDGEEGGSDDYYDSDDMSESTLDETEMQEVLGSLCCFGSKRNVAWSS